LFANIKNHNVRHSQMCSSSSFSIFWSSVYGRGNAIEKRFFVIVFVLMQESNIYIFCRWRRNTTRWRKSQTFRQKFWKAFWNLHTLVLLLLQKTISGNFWMLLNLPKYQACALHRNWLVLLFRKQKNCYICLLKS